MSRRGTGVRFAAGLVGVLSSVLAPAAGTAAPIELASTEATLTAERDLVSVGDTFGVEFLVDFGLVAAGVDMDLVYVVDRDAEPVPGTIRLEGEELDLADVYFPDDGRLVVPVGDGGRSSYKLEFSLRAVGAIGEDVAHAAGIDVEGARAVSAFTPPTWIEDETASLDYAAVEADARIAASSPGSNYGGSTELHVLDALDDEDRSLVQFDAADLRGSVEEIRSARAEFWIASPPSGSTPILAHALRTAWVEGRLDGGSCALTFSCSWNSPNCLLGWDAGGDYDADIAGSVFLGRSSAWTAIEITDLASRWIAGTITNRGLILLANGASNTGTTVFVSREGAEAGLGEEPRLAVLHAPNGAYDERAVNEVIAEIVPSVVPTGIPNRRFAYEFSLTAKPTNTGVNRLQISVPAAFEITSVDSIVAGDEVWVADPVDGGAPSFENWGDDETLDLRLSPAFVPVDTERATVVFRANTPTTESSTGHAFPSAVDHDRRGYPVQLATRGDANGQSGERDGDTWTVKVVDIVRAVEISPVDSTLALGGTVDYTAVAVYDDGKRAVVTDLADWTVEPDSLGSFDDGATLQTLREGDALVRARYESVDSDDASLRIDPPALIGLEVRPAQAAVAAGDSTQFRAIGIYSDGSEVDVSGQATWAVGDGSIAQHTDDGWVTGLTPGSTLVRATVDGVPAATALLDVGPPLLVSIAIAPADTSVALGSVFELRAQGSYSDGSTANLTSTVAWSSNPDGIVEIGDDGRTRSLATGVALARASFDGVDSDVASITVTPAVLVALDGAPDTSTVPAGITASLTSTGIYSDGTVSDKTDAVTWTSLDPGVADFTGPGILETYVAGDARIRHAIGGVEGDTLLVTVAPVTISEVRVTPSPLELPPGIALSLTATAVLTDSSEIDVTQDATWISDAPGIATVSADGELQTVAEGAAQITATVTSVTSDPCAVTVDAAALDQLEITPADRTVALGDSVVYAALGHFGGDVFDVSASATWAVQDTTVARMASPPVLHTVGEGATTITASIGATTADPATVTVLPPEVIALEVRPSTSTLLVGRSRDLTAFAVLSDGTESDVTDAVTWASSAPSIAYVDANGRVFALSVGDAVVTAEIDGTFAPDVPIRVLPSVTAQAVPTGTVQAWPGAQDQPMLLLRFENHHTTARVLEALRVSVPGGGSESDAIDGVALWLDDGDGTLEPTQDTLLTSGVLASGSWTAAQLGLPIAVGTQSSLFVAADLSDFGVAQGDSLDLELANAGDLIWSEATSVVPQPGFPLRSAGRIVVDGLVLAQLETSGAPVDTTAPATSNVELVRVTLPSNGGVADQLETLRVRQIGSALPGSDLAALRLQYRNVINVGELDGASGAFENASLWTDAGTLVLSGGETWSATELGLTVPSAGLEVRVVADVAASAQVGRSLRLELPLSALEFTSGRVGPQDGTFVQPNAVIIDVVPTLVVSACAESAPSVVARDDARVPLLALDLETSGAPPDSLRELTLRHTSTGQDDAGADPHAQVTEAELWIDADRDGAVSGADTWVASSGAPPSGGRLIFDALAIPLPAATRVPLLVTLTVDPTQVRDDERLAVELAAPADVVTDGGLAVVFDTPAPLGTFDPPRVDGQDAAGYDLRPISGGLLRASTDPIVVLDLLLPSNGYEDDRLVGFEVRNAGSATASDVTRLSLVQDDGDGVLDDGDALVADLTAIGDRRWRADGLDHLLTASSTTRYFVRLESSLGPTPGSTFLATIPVGGVEVASGNDGPRDVALQADEAWVFTGSEVVTWLAGAVGDVTVAPNASLAPVLVLEAFNGYANPRTLEGLDVRLTGSALDREFAGWTLHHDADESGGVSAGDVLLRTGFAASGAVSFDGFALSLPPAEQERLILSATLEDGEARDASTVNALVADATEFTYVEVATTATVGEFPLDSAGRVLVDGHVLDQLVTQPVASLALPAGESRVLALDVAVPSNGWSDDVLNAITFELVDFGESQTARLGDDVEAVELWVESDAGAPGASFDPQADLRLERFDASEGPIRFEPSAVSIPRGGRRLYVTVDVHPQAADGRQIQLRVPTDGIEVASGNDGPRDAPLVASAIHRVSNRDLLASVRTSTSQASVGQTVDVWIDVRNLGDDPLTGVELVDVGLEPAGAATLVEGPTPASMDLASGDDGSFRLRWRLDAATTLRFDAIAGVDGGVQSDEATSLPLVVEAPPSALSVDPQSNVPVSVNRGQRGVVPLRWELAHPDPEGGAADISIRAFDFTVETANGQPQSARAVIDRLELRTGGLVHAYWDDVPDSTSLRVTLDEAIVLASGEERVLPLEVGIAPDATASDFRLRIEAVAAADAVDANSGLPVPLTAPASWTTSGANILTPADRADFEPFGTLPTAANRGQTDIPLLRFEVSLPGAPGESEARVTALHLALRDADGAPIAPGPLFERVRVVSEGASLLDTSAYAVDGDVWTLPLTIPKSFASGAPVVVDVRADLLAAPTTDAFSVVLADSTALVVRDSNTGVVVETEAATPLPFVAGPLAIQDASPAPTVVVAPNLPSSVGAGARGVPVARVTVTHPGAAGSAALELRAVHAKTLDTIGEAMAAAAVLEGAVLQTVDATPVALGETTTFGGGEDFAIALTPPLRIEAGAAETFELRIDLDGDSEAPFLRLRFDDDALLLVDANDSTQTRDGGDALPVTTPATAIVRAPSAAAMGVDDDPPVNAVRGATFGALALSLAHPGSAGEAEITPSSLVVRTLDVDGAAVDANRAFAAASLRLDETTITGTVRGDSLHFDLASLPALDAGAVHRVAIDLQVHAAPTLDDVAFGLDAGGFVALAPDALDVIALDGTALPYRSPAVHLSAGDLASSVSNYPNPFAAGRESTSFAFVLEAAARVTVELFTVTGERVIRLLDERSLDAGLHDGDTDPELRWDGRNGDGAVVRNGTYLLRVVVDGPSGGEFLRKVAVRR